MKSEVKSQHVRNKQAEKNPTVIPSRLMLQQTLLISVVVLRRENIQEKNWRKMAREQEIALGLLSSEKYMLLREY